MNLMLTSPHIHLLLNHIPILGSIFASVLLVVAMARGSEELRRLSFIIFVGDALITAPVYFSGSYADHIVNHVAGVVDDLIDPHEWAAEIAAILAGVLGVYALVGLIVYRRAASLPGWFSMIGLVLAL